ncbi:hypothetical protein FA10DRAFT_268127 [Acaromyces ingoldii]|uniref:NADH dehydrogenase [ubiquinone] 1 alpha subcomplex assembly factor 3 n=1 Tax=Acaromyces ingoldii TaxID=215250 RepID=A0A316YK95_9BASI|nr:hypothetical protein FA10DRAFT_268127 [Acaromyces ingoldii]PWN89602.1 hypothetical protein FA10DRAFT_268127 [Acaromyces ingoldii]
MAPAHRLACRTAGLAGRLARSAASSSSVAPRLASAVAAPRYHRNLSTSRIVRLPSDDPGGKPNDGSYPTVYDDFKNITASDQPQLSVHSLAEDCITLSDGLVVHQPAILLNGQALLWDAPLLDLNRAMPSGPGWEAWSDEAWRVFEICTPRPEIIIFGTGKRVLPPPASVKRYLNTLGIQLEAHDTRNASSTYNLLTEEGRLVAAALIPATRKPTKRVISGTAASDGATTGAEKETEQLKGAAVLS